MQRDQLIGKFSSILTELGEIVGMEKIKLGELSVDFCFNSFTCMFYLTNSKIVFNQIFLVDPSGKAFSAYVENEIEKSNNMKSLIISLLHLFRTGTGFVNDFCRAVYQFDLNSNVSCYIPLVLPTLYCTSAGMPQHTIMFNSGTKILTLFLIFRVNKTKKNYPLFLSYNIEKNTMSIPEKYSSALESFVPIIDELSRVKRHDEIRFCNYLTEIKQKIPS